MELKFSKPTKFEWIAFCFVLGSVAFMTSVLLTYMQQIRFGAVKYVMSREVGTDILDPIENKYKIVKWTVANPPDDTIELNIELDSEAGEQAFHIARDVYELKRKSPVLSKKPLELKIRVREPKCGVNLHAYIPGAPDHRKKRDLEEYRELDRKWREIIRQKEQEERRAAAASANPSSADAGNEGKRAEDDPAPQQMPQ